MWPNPQETGNVRLMRLNGHQIWKAATSRHYFKATDVKYKNQMWRARCDVKDKNKMWSMFKVNNKDTRMTPFPREST